MPGGRDRKHKGKEDTVRPTYDELVKLAMASLKYLQHPEVQAITHGFALSGAVIERRLEKAIAEAENTAKPVISDKSADRIARAILDSDSW
jgi:hypothetical protein